MLHLETYKVFEFRFRVLILFFKGNDLEESLSISEGGEVSSSCLLSEVLSGDNLVGEGSEDCHHSSTSVVKFSVLLTVVLGRLFLPVIETSETDSVVSREVRCGPPGKLNESTEKDDLSKSSSRNLEKSSNSRVDVGEFKSSRRGKVSIESPSVVVDEGSEHSHHSNTSVLALYSTVTDEGLLVFDVSKGIEVSEGSYSSNLILKLGSSEGGGNLGLMIEKDERKKLIG